jgi:hypothetical protein
MYSPILIIPNRLIFLKVLEQLRDAILSWLDQVDGVRHRVSFTSQVQ